MACVCLAQVSTFSFTFGKQVLALGCLDNLRFAMITLGSFGFG